MSLEVRHVDAGFVVQLHNDNELPVLGLVARQLGDSAPTTVVVDVSVMTLASHDAGERLVAHIRAAAASAPPRHRWAIVAGRPATRMTLRQLCAHAAIGVYPTVEDAIAAEPSWRHA
jgi:hypothetical protein